MIYEDALLVLRENWGSVGLSLLIIFLAYDTFKPLQSPPKTAPAVVEEARGFTFEELRKFNGIKDKRVYVAITGTVYDVSSSGFYAPHAPYHIFAGKDASRLLAKNAFVKETEEEASIALSTAELVALQEWKSFFEQKYRVAGWVDPEMSVVAKE